VQHKLTMHEDISKSRMDKLRTHKMDSQNPPFIDEPESDVKEQQWGVLSNYSALEPTETNKNSLHIYTRSLRPKQIEQFSINQSQTQHSV